MAVSVLSASLSDDSRVLSILTSPQTHRVAGRCLAPHSDVEPVQLGIAPADDAPRPRRQRLPGRVGNRPTVTLTVRRSWLPHADLQVARELTAGSASHEQFLTAIAASGTAHLPREI